MNAPVFLNVSVCIYMTVIFEFYKLYILCKFGIKLLVVYLEGIILNKSVALHWFPLNK